MLTTAVARLLRAGALLRDVRVPAFLHGGAHVTHAGLLLGGASSGIALHAHNDAVNCVLRGSKLCELRAPESLLASRTSRAALHLHGG